MKKIPYGIANYEKIKTEGYYFVDKTHFIEKIESLGSPYLFFLRPRRFGKSLFLSILEHYYDILKKEEFETLFGDTYIGKHSTDLRNSFPILKFNFSTIAVGEGLEVAKKHFDLHVKNSIKSFFRKYGKIYPQIKKSEKEILSIGEAPAIMESFIATMYDAGIKYYLLIDEYDNFANNILIEHGKKIYKDTTHGRGFLRGFFAIIKAGTENRTIERLFITGVSPLVLSDVTSGMNIGDNISIYPSFEDMVGFTAEEVEKLVDYYIKEGAIKKSDKEKLLETISEFANNYYFSRQKRISVHNSDIILYIIKNYMQFGKLPDDPIDPNIRTDYGKLRFLVVESNRLNGNFNILQEIADKGEIDGNLVDSFPLEEIISEDKFVSLLYYLGLLTIKESYEGNLYSFTIPNLTVKNLLWEYIRKAIEEVYDLRISTRKLALMFRDMAHRGEWKDLFKFIFEEFYNLVSSVRDFIWREEGVSMFLRTYLSLSPYYIIESEYETSGGYVDIYLRKNWAITEMTRYEYLIELKHVKLEGRKKISADDLKKIKQEAIEQIKKYASSKKLKPSPFVDNSRAPELKKIIIITSSSQVEIMEEV